MSKLKVVIVALCALAAGLAIGLTIGSLASGPIQDMAVDRARAELEAEVARLKQYATEMGANNLKTNAFIGLLIKEPVLRDLLLEPPISNSFESRGGWYYPQAAVGLLGGRWLAEELMAEGLLRNTFLDTADILKAGETFKEGKENPAKALYDDLGPD